MPTQYTKATWRPAVTIGGKTFVTPVPAARHWALWVRINKYERHRDLIGHAAYHDKEWCAIPAVANAEETAFRRSLPIFRRYFGKK